ncbi:hypothetical protein [Bdellovibrio reynosensis]|uniref:F5/8 type C domain-containing protein n=1 Tax=Bdellovibrio reynosensis TaxID=2835041 RepID=A0ABY4CCV2_9BACT|nr:hypothetical protein [Bdellovibrio reynosensis]UOF02544.1 hypothetical protein MNR06_06210 [Bdellovibrio reynosensis]
MKKLFLFVLFFNFSQIGFAGSPPLPPKPPTSCTVLHPSELVWQRPDKSVWTGDCANKTAQGYGWYKFDLAKEGFADSRVEILIEFDQGRVANKYYYVIMYTDNEASFEGFAELGGYQVDLDSCLKISECTRTLEFLKSEVTEPIQPTNCLGQEVEEEHEDREGLIENQELLKTWAAEAAECAIAAVDRDADLSPTIKEEMDKFIQNFFPFTRAICQQNGRANEQCEIQQLRKLANLFRTIHYKHDLDKELASLHSSSDSLSEKCNDQSANNFNTCWTEEIEALEERIKLKNPTAGKYASQAFEALAYALAYLEANSGSRYMQQVSHLREELAWYVWDLVKSSRVPEPPAPQPQPKPQEEFPTKFTDMGQAKQIFHLAVQRTTDHMLQRVDREKNGAQNIKDGIALSMQQFKDNYDSYTTWMCIRKKALVIACVIYQYEKAVLSMSNFLKGTSIYKAAFPTSYTSFLYECGGNPNNRDHNRCWKRKIDELEQSVLRRHPNGGKAGAEALAGYAWAISYFDNWEGYSAAVTKNYEAMIFYLNEQASVAW